MASGLKGLCYSFPKCHPTSMAGSMALGASQRYFWNVQDFWVVLEMSYQNISSTQVPTMAKLGSWRSNTIQKWFLLQTGGLPSARLGIQKISLLDSCWGTSANFGSLQNSEKSLWRVVDAVLLDLFFVTFFWKIYLDTHNASYLVCRNGFVEII